MKMRYRRKGFYLAWFRSYENGILTTEKYWYYKGKP
jgi:hypothetical protein